MSETRTISIPVYRDPEGSPVCALSGKVRCICLQTALWPRTCKATDTETRLDDDGYIRPTPNCPLWRDEVKS